MRARTTILLILGILLALAGSVFALQGMGIIGPTSSFMYSSSTWIYNGGISALVGVILIVLALVIARSDRKAGEKAGKQPSTTATNP